MDWLESHSDLVIAVLAERRAVEGEYAAEVWADRETVERMRDDPGRWKPGPTRIAGGFRIESFRPGGPR
jgi:hypothetical protein